MDRQEIMKKINYIFKDIFDDDTLSVSDNTTPSDIPEWDSLQHINLISMLEKEFCITFEVDEIVSMEKVGDIREILEKKVS